MADTVTLQAWVAYLFDHPVESSAWYFAVDAIYLQPGGQRVAELVAETFEQSATLLQPFSDAQLNQGFWFLLGTSGHMFELTDAAVAWPVRQRAWRSIVPLFREVMARRCTPALSHLDEPGASPLNLACYMWWDLMPVAPAPTSSDTSRRLLDDELLAVMTALLKIPHDACRESALHGLGHWALSEKRAVPAIDTFLARSADLRPDLLAYAKAARSGCIL
jgi:hypothetical protein